jgi:hypothetical protein
MTGRYIYQVVATILPNGVGGETVQHDLGIFTTLKQAEKFMKGFVDEGDFYCPVYSYSIQFLPQNDEWEYQSERYLNIYSPDGELQISEFNMFTCGAGWDKQRNMHVRAYIDIGPKKKAYFVVFNHWRPGLAAKCARISFLEPKYELGGSYNKAVWFLNEREKKDLYDYLNSPTENPMTDIHNTWQRVISAFNNEVQGDDDNRMLPYDLSMPDYRRL